jgi:hypothetical protein
VPWKRKGWVRIDITPLRFPFWATKTSQTAGTLCEIPAPMFFVKYLKCIINHTKLVFKFVEFRKRYIKSY